MAGGFRVVAVTDDLMFRSQLGTAVRGAGGEVVSAGPDEAAGRAGGVEAVFVDLNRDGGDRLGLIARLRAAHPTLQIVAFCHHGEREIREMAMRVGASSCVTNGALQAVALRLAGTAVPGGRRVD